MNEHPVPKHAKRTPDAEITPAMRKWAADLEEHPGVHPLNATAMKDFDGHRVLAHVEKVVDVDPETGQEVDAATFEGETQKRGRVVIHTLAKPAAKRGK